MNPQSIVDSMKERFGQGTSQQREEKDILSRAQRQYNYMKQARRKAEYEMWLNDQFYQGEQYAYYNPQTKLIERYAYKNDSNLIINKIKQNARYVIMWLNRDHPTSRVMPATQDDAAYDHAKKTEHLLSYWYDALDLSTENKLTTMDAYKYKLGAQKILWDGQALAPTSPFNGGITKIKGEVTIKRVDPYELLLDPQLSGVNVDDCRFLCHTMPRTLGELRNNKNYKNTDKVTGDSKTADSMLKESIIRAQTVGAAQFNPDNKDDLATTLVRELYAREFDKEKGDWVIRKTVFTGNGILLDSSIWPLDFYPFELYLADMQGSILDGGGPVRDLRSPQRAFNQIMSIIHENAQVMGKINYKMPRGANVNVITDEVGQFLEYDVTPGGSPEQLQPASLPAYMPNHATYLAQLLDDLGGNHSASYGKSPGSKASGELVNRLQEGDSNNLVLMRSNLDDLQRRVYKKALKTFSKFGTADRMIRSKETNATGRYDFWSVKPKDVSVDCDIEVVTGSKMPYSMQDRQEMLLNMKKEGVITNEQFLKAINIPDLDNVLNTAQLDVERALDENRRLLKGEVLEDPAKGEDHQVHMQVHVQLIKSPAYLEADPMIQDNIQAHYAAHIDMSVQLAMISNSLNVEPIKRNETVMFRQDFNQLTPIERTQAMSKVGIQSDAGEIQARGGLNIQDPGQAELQAQTEDTAMLDGKPVMIAIGDNHQVHIETHSQIMETAAWEHVPEPIKNLFNEHIKQHVQQLQAQAPMPGLVPNKNYDVPNQPQIVHPVNQAANNPNNSAPRPLMPHEFLQPKGAVQNQMASEQMAAKEQQAQEQAKAKEQQSSAKPKTGRKAKGL